MDTHILPVYTLADVLAAIQDAELSATKRRDMVSAVNRVAEIFELPPARIPVRIPELRKRLRVVMPSAHGISRKTFSNLRALFASALVLAGVAEPLGRGCAKRDSKWAALVEAVEDDKRMANGLAAFANWCASRGIAPGEVNDVAVAEFLAWLEASTLHPKPRDVARRVPNIWNEAGQSVEGWPQQQLARISFKTPSQNLAWSDLDATFRA